MAADGAAAANAHFFHLLRGRQPPYPETTGYIIPTLHALYRRSGNLGLQVSVAIRRYSTPTRF
jgi:hypothetical protein